MDFEFLIALVVAGVLFFPILAIAGFVRAGTARREVDALVARVAALEAALGSRTVASEAPAAQPAAETPVEPAPTSDAAAAIPAATEPAAAGPPEAEPPPPARPGFEERFAARWAVWLGTGAIALAMVFLVRYSIEEGLLGPTARIVLALLFGVALLAASEWLRRRLVDGAAPGVLGRIGVPPPNIPPAVAAAGVVTLYAATFAAFAVHDLIAPMTAFVSLAVISALAMALSLLHGPMVALLGQVAAFAVPAFAGGGHPFAPGLFGYVLAVSGGCLALARYRGWRWTAWPALAGAMVWLFVWCAGGLWQARDEIWIVLFVVLLAALFVFLGPAPLDEEDGDERWRTRDLLPDLPLVVLLVAASSVVRMSSYGIEALLGLFVLVAGIGFVARRVHTRLDHLPLPAALVAAWMMAAWHVGSLSEQAFTGSSITPEFVLAPSAWRFLTWNGAFAALCFLGGAAAMIGAPRAWRWAALAALMPALFFVVAYWRIEDFAASAPWTAAALALAGLMLGASMQAQRLAAGDERATASRDLAVALFALGVTLAASLAMTTMLRTGWLTVALSLQIPALAWIARRITHPALRWGAGVLGAVIVARLLLNPSLVDYPLGTTPIFNALLYVYGIPTLAFAIGARMFAAGGRDQVVVGLEIGALAFFTFLVTTQIRHAVTGGRLDADPEGLLEAALHSIAWLSIALGLYAQEERLATPVARWGWRVLGTLGTLAVVLGSLLAANPLVERVAVGRLPLVNLLGLAYLVPALLAAAFAWIALPRGQRWLVQWAGGGALLLGFVYVTLEVTRACRGSVIVDGDPSDAETYAYSAVWLVYGIGLLLLGLWLGQKALRYASLAVVALTIAKVFLFDMAQLTGVLRVLSFLGLGLALLGLGWVYQRFVLRGGAAPGTTT